VARPFIALDANASVPPVPEARAAIVAAFDDAAGANPTSPPAAGRRARRLLDRARDACAPMLGASAKDVFFTSGATEGNRFVVDALIEAAAAAGRPWHVVTSPVEHPSLHKPLQRARTRGLLTVTPLPVQDGHVVTDGPLVAALIATADAVVVTAAHNETGMVTDLERFLPLCPATALVAVDAAQSLGRRGPPPPQADIVVASAHKLGGVAGAGALVLRGRARSLPLPWVAGGQEQGVRPGTENVLGIAALGAAADVIERTRSAHRALAPLRDRLEAAVVAAGARPLGATRDRLENTSAFLVPGVDADALRLALDQAGVAVGFGAACSALAPEPSPSLRALGLDAADARRVVRVSLAPGTGVADVDDATARIVEVIRRLA
jgi:cysteine desulfurase